MSGDFKPKALRYIAERPLLISSLGFMLLLRQVAKFVLEVIRGISIGMFYMAMTIGESLIQLACGSFGMVGEPANTLRKASHNSNNPHTPTSHPALSPKTVSPSSSSCSSSPSSSRSCSGCSSPMSTPNSSFYYRRVPKDIFKGQLSMRLVEVAGQASRRRGWY